MSSPPLFYFPDLTPDAEAVVLDGAEAVHMAGARRLRVGDRAELFDGQGLVASGRIVNQAQRGQRLEIDVEQRTSYPEPERRLLLATALPKGERLATMLELATQLGMTDFLPLTCERSVVKPGQSMGDRWQRIAVSACKQCRRYHLPRLRQPQSLEKLLDESVACVEGVLLADPAGGRATELPKSVLQQRTIIMLVGPEGGFSEREVQLTEQRGVRKVWLGPNILRTEAAAAAIIAAINQQLPWE